MFPTGSLPDSPRRCITSSCYLIFVAGARYSISVQLAGCDLTLGLLSSLSAGDQLHCGEFSGVYGTKVSFSNQTVRLYVNFFQPSFKQLEKEKHGAKMNIYYDKPKTPCERLLSHPAVPDEVKEKLELQQRALDPLALLHSIQEQQAALAALASRENNMTGPSGESLGHFMKQLGELWRQGEVRAAHRTSPKKAHWGRTRKDPFESVWPNILLWLQDTPDATAKELFEREQLGYFQNGQLRTLQRRVRTWRRVMAKGLVYAGLDASVSSEFVAQPGPRQAANSSVTFLIEATGLEGGSVGFLAHLSVPTAFESAFSYFERKLTSFQIIFYHPGRGEEAKLALVRSFSWRSRKGNYYP